MFLIPQIPRSSAAGSLIHEYRLLKDLWCHAMGTTMESTKFVGMDFNDPGVDVQKIALGLGARTDKIAGRAAISDAMARALAYLGPTFLVIDREPQGNGVTLTRDKYRALYFESTYSFLKGSPPCFLLIY